MIVYLGSCFASMLLAFILTRQTRGLPQKKAAMVLAAMPMIFVAAVRYDVGEDYFGY